MIIVYIKEKKRLCRLKPLQAFSTQGNIKTLH